MSLPLSIVELREEEARFDALVTSVANSVLCEIDPKAATATGDPVALPRESGVPFLAAAMALAMAPPRVVNPSPTRTSYGSDSGSYRSCSDSTQESSEGSQWSPMLTPHASPHATY